MLFFLLYKIGSILALGLPVEISYRLASFISRIKYALSFIEKKEMAQNLRQVLPDVKTEALRAASVEIFANFSKYLVDFLRFKNLDMDYIREHVALIGRDYIDEALKKGRGVILLSAHLGSWELGGAAMGILGYPINVIALDHKNKLVNDFFVRQRQMKNERVISVNFAVRRSLAVLAENKLVAIVGDKDYTKNGVVVKFFGRDTLLPKGAAILSLKTGAAIVPTYLIRIEGDKFELRFENPVDYSPSGDFDSDILRLTEACAARLEGSIKRYPTQWYCFRRFWIGGTFPRFPPSGTLHGDRPVPLKLK